MGPGWGEVSEGEMIQIKHRYSGEILFEVEVESLKAALEIVIDKKANLHEADLRGADLIRVNLIGADLIRVNLIGADLIDGGQDSRGYRFLGQHKDNTLYIHAGCRYFSIDEAEEHWSKEHQENPDLHAECLARVALIKQIAKARGWLNKTEKKA